jgi:signal transduction histidine kinase
VVHVSVSASPIRGSGGTIIGVSAIARDVTSRKALETSRQVVEDRLHAVLESAPLVLFSYDMDLRFTSYRAGKVLPDFVAREADCIGRSVLQLHAGDHGLSEQLQRSLRGERVVTEVEVLGHMLEVRFAPEFDAAGRQIGVNGVTIDISDQVKARKDQEHLAERLRQHERLESVGQLAGGIAHDFNNLLAVIINCAFFVTREIDDKEAIRADIAHIERAAERAAQLTRQLLAFARRENLQPQVVDMNLAVSGIEPMLRRTLGEHVILLTELGPDLWPVLVDPGQFEQVLVNLAVNARDAMPHGGVLTIDTENVEIDEALRSLRPDLAVGRYVRVRVSDNGTGIEKSVLEHIFEPFFTTKPAGEGTGLGLATVFGIVAQAGGDVQIYSELGVGTTCRVLLPACEGAPMPVLEPREIRSLFGTETVLVVEDEDPLRDVARRLLVDNGYTVFVTGSGEEALRLVGELDGPIDLLLTDVVMPHMLGTEVATRLKEQQPGLMVLYMSGHAHTVLGPILDSSAALVEKPFTERSLLEKVREVLEAGR